MADLYDLPLDIFCVIILLWLSSSDGAQNFARAMSVSKKFRSCVKDKKVLEALSFDNVSITNRCRTFLRSSKLLFKSAKVGNLSAQHLISKVLVVSSSYLYGNTEVLGSPDPTQAENHNAANDTLLAGRFVDLVKRTKAGCHLKEILQNFLRRCSHGEIAELGEQLTWCVRYFLEKETTDHTRFFTRVLGMMIFGRDIDAGAKVNVPELRKTINEKTKVMMEQRRSRKKTRGASSSYSIALEMATEISFLHMKLECIYELGFRCPCCGVYEADPSIYFEQCQLDALEDFALFFELV